MGHGITIANSKDLESSLIPVALAAKRKLARVWNGFFPQLAHHFADPAGVDPGLGAAQGLVPDQGAADFTTYGTGAGATQLAAALASAVFNTFHELEDLWPGQVPP